MTGPVRFGVLGATSTVFQSAVKGAIDAVAGTELVHVASRGGSPPVADGVTLSREYGAVLADDDVDVVYIPLPNHLHEEWVLAAAAAGRHVLCEKPLATSGAAARRMVAACTEADVHLLEAYMSPFHPRAEAVQAAVDDGVLGEVLHGSARMGGWLPRDNHRWEHAKGGGALWDVGIYCLEPVLTALGWDGETPEQVAVAARFAGDGVDETTSAWLELPGGRTASLWVSFSAPDHQHLTLVGTDRELVVTEQHATGMHDDDTYLLRERDGTVNEVRTTSGSAYEGMISHVRDVVRGDVPPRRPTSRILSTVDLVERLVEAGGQAG